MKITEFIIYVAQISVPPSSLSSHYLSRVVSAEISRQGELLGTFQFRLPSELFFIINLRARAEESTFYLIPKSKASALCSIETAVFLMDFGEFLLSLNQH